MGMTVDLATIPVKDSAQMTQPVMRSGGGRLPWLPLLTFRIGNRTIDARDIPWLRLLLVFTQ